MLTPEQIEERRKGVGASDIGPICGLSIGRSAGDVFLEKIGEAKPVEETEAMWWGNALEDDIAERVCKERNIPLVEHGVMVQPEEQWQRCSPDRLEPDKVAGYVSGWELKCAFSTEQVHRFLDLPADAVPEEYYLQCLWSSMVTDLPWNLAVFLAGYHGPEFRIYEILSNPEREAQIYTIAKHFWFDHVQKRLPPEADGTVGTTAAYERVYKDVGPARPASDEDDDAVQGYQHALADVKTSAKALEKAKQELMAQMKEAVQIDGHNYRATWKPNKRGKRLLKVQSW